MRFDDDDNLEVIQANSQRILASALTEPNSPLLQALNSISSGAGASNGQVISDLTNAIVALTTALNNPKGPLVTALGAEINKIPTAIKEAAGQIGGPPEPGPPQDKDKADRLMLCFRAINQAEDVIADTTFDPKKANEELRKRAQDKLTDAAKVPLPSSPLLTAFEKIFDPIKHTKDPDLWQERAARLAEIMKLRRDVCAFFAS